MASILRSATARVSKRSVPPCARSLATHSSSSEPGKRNFAQTLAEGPSFDDFVAGDVPERVVMGNTSQYAFRCISLLPSRIQRKML